MSRGVAAIRWALRGWGDAQTVDVCIGEDTVVVTVGELRRAMDAGVECLRLQAYIDAATTDAERLLAQAKTAADTFERVRAERDQWREGWQSAMDDMARERQRAADATRLWSDARDNLRAVGATLGIVDVPDDAITDAILAAADAMRTECERLRRARAAVDAIALEVTRESMAAGHRDFDVIERLTAERDEARAIVAGMMVAPTDAEMREHMDAGGAWLVTIPARKQVRLHPETRYVDTPREASLLWWTEGALWIAVREGRPCAWPRVAS